jgi:MFS family permease
LGLGALNLINVTRLGNLSGKKGKISGVFSLFSVAGSISGPILGGIIGSLFNLQTIYLILIPLFILLLIRVYYKTDVKISKVVLNEFIEKS